MLIMVLKSVLRVIFLCVTLLPYNGVCAQFVLEQDCFLGSNQDSLIIDQIDYFSPGSSGEDVTWVVTPPTDNEYRKVKYYKTISDSTYSCLYDNRVTVYKNTDKRTEVISEETPYELTEYIQPLLQLQYPLNYGDSACSAYESRGVCWGTHHTHTLGEVHLKADAYGQISLGQKRFIRDVLRVYTLRTASLSMNVDRSRVDSVERKQEIVERYQWFAKGCSHPILETVSSTSYDKGEKLGTVRKAYRCIPEEILSDAEEGNDTILDAPQQQNPVIDYSIAVKGRNVEVCFRTVSKISVRTVVCNMQGFVLLNRQDEAVPEEACQLSLDCSSFKKGTYVLYLNADGNVISEVFNLQ